MHLADVAVLEIVWERGGDRIRVDNIARVIGPFPEAGLPIGRFAGGNAFDDARSGVDLGNGEGMRKGGGGGRALGEGGGCRLCGSLVRGPRRGFLLRLPGGKLGLRPRLGGIPPRHELRLHLGAPRIEGLAAGIQRLLARRAGGLTLLPRRITGGLALGLCLRMGAARGVTLLLACELIGVALGGGGLALGLARRPFRRPRFFLPRRRPLLPRALRRARLFLLRLRIVLLFATPAAAAFGLGFGLGLGLFLCGDLRFQLRFELLLNVPLRAFLDALLLLACALRSPLGTQGRALLSGSRGAPLRFRCGGARVPGGGEFAVRAAREVAANNLARFCAVAVFLDGGAESQIHEVSLGNKGAVTAWAADEPAGDVLDEVAALRAAIDAWARRGAAGSVVDNERAKEQQAIERHGHGHPHPFSVATVSAIAVPIASIRSPVRASSVACTVGQARAWGLCCVASCTYGP